MILPDTTFEEVISDDPAVYVGMRAALARIEASLDKALANARSGGWDASASDLRNAGREAACLELSARLAALSADMDADKQKEDARVIATVRTDIQLPPHGSIQYKQLGRDGDVVQVITRDYNATRPSNQEGCIDLLSVPEDVANE